MLNSHILDQEFTQSGAIKTEFNEFYLWFRKQPLRTSSGRLIKLMLFYKNKY